MPQLRCSRTGAALLLAALVMLAVSVLGVSMLTLGDYNGIELVRGQQAVNAFWIAEGGVHYALAKLQKQQSYRMSPVPLTNSLADGTFAVSVVRTGKLHTITSTGRGAGGGVRTVRLVTEVWDNGWPMAFSDYALFSGSGNVSLGQSADVTGSVYAGGLASFGSGSTLSDGTVRDSTTVTNAPPPPSPPFSTAPYDVLIAAASVWPGPAPSYPLNLGGVTNFVKGNASIGDVQGPGVLAVSGNIGLSKDVIVGSNVWLISGDTLTINKGFDAGTNCMLYASEEILIDKEGLTLSGCALITPGDITIKKAIAFTGVMYAGGSIRFDKDANITGSIVALGTVSGDKDVTFTHDPNAFPGTLPPGFTGEVRMRRVVWEDRGSVAGP
jgi:hypothetical protein